jgi:hypothetical protein
MLKYSRPKYPVVLVLGETSGPAASIPALGAGGSEAVTPVRITATRPAWCGIRVHVPGAGELPEMLWFLYAPWTVIELDARPPLHRENDAVSAAEMTARVRQALNAPGQTPPTPALSPARAPLQPQPAASAAPDVATMVCSMVGACLQGGRRRLAP